MRSTFRLPTSRLARVVYASVILTSVSLVSIFHARPRVWTVDEVPVAFWAWRTQSPDKLDIQAAVEKTKAHVLFLRAGQIDYREGKFDGFAHSPGRFPRVSSCTSFTTLPAPFSSSLSRLIPSRSRMKLPQRSEKIQNEQDATAPM